MMMYTHPCGNAAVYARLQKGTTPDRGGYQTRADQFLLVASAGLPAIAGNEAGACMGQTDVRRTEPEMISYCHPS